MSLRELLALPRRPSSEERLDSILAPDWSPEPFGRAALNLQQKAGLGINTIRRGDMLPALCYEVKYKYRSSYDTCTERFAAEENLLIVTIRDSKHILGFGIAAIKEMAAEIEIIEVERSSSRSAGLAEELTIAGQLFSVGIGHLIVELLSSDIDTEIRVDATGPSSRYIFKSLGFIPIPSDSNPCHLFRHRKT